MSFDTSPRLSDEPLDPLDIIWESLPYDFHDLTGILALPGKTEEETNQSDLSNSYEFGEVPFDWYEFGSGRS